MKMKKMLIALMAGLLILAACTTKPTLTQSTQNIPTEGFNLHIDAKRHVESDRNLVVHHYCKMYPSGFAECQLYDRDSADAKLIGIEVVIGKDLFDQLSPEEQKKWHHHEKEIARKEVDIQLPGLSPEQATEVAKTLGPTYGKIYIIWEPNEKVSLAQPKVVIV